MKFNRRSFIKAAAIAPAITLPFVSCSETDNSVKGQNSGTGIDYSNLQNMMGDVKPISREERQSRIEKAQELMRKNKVDALFLEPGTSMKYFLDFDFFLSERMVAAVIPANGDVMYVCPKFEEDKVGELVKFGSDIRTWEEHESPYAVVKGILSDKVGRTGTLGIEERCRFFLYDGIKGEASGFNYVLADDITAGCRIYKSASEIALLQKANDITIDAYKKVFDSLREGMTQDDFREVATQAHKALGVTGSIGANFGKWTAFPHGSSKMQTLKEGDVILADGGCAVEGYRSDISRTIVFGKPTERHKEVWNLAKEAQAAAFDLASKSGTTCEDLDKVARGVISDGGFGPDYKYFSHRLGHGIGMDGHEWTNLVRGNKTPLEKGMCFSNEPGIYIVGEFGVRVEDCMYIGDDGPVYFSQPSPSIDEPFA
ncbi:MAG: aminopeptidase P family protein [Mongoliibacter sp.]|uniref:M24 family metallopeptidase n=1 Tax=Mongoliibacter sp. TaxID=2022438 RepID=UPI0012F3AA5C|nr:Xaa-Pro peptidase family protein [Mongoliibacter sp.]TVP50848.1 MAG: aminopeptidase P family protein [Mongoliibacter sp.]